MRENKRAARATRSYGKHLWTDVCAFCTSFVVLFRRNVAKLLEKATETTSWTIFSHLVGREGKLHYLISQSCGCWAVKETSITNKPSLLCLVVFSFLLTCTASELYAFNSARVLSPFRLNSSPRHNLKAEQISVRSWVLIISESYAGFPIVSGCFPERMPIVMLRYFNCSEPKMLTFSSKYPFIFVNFS